MDTSVFIALESNRPIDASLLPDESLICPITLAELQAGVLAAADLGTRARRMTTLQSISDIELLTIDGSVASEWAWLRVYLAQIGRRINVNDLWIAATAAAHQLPVVTQDDDFDPLSGVGGLEVIHV